MHSRTSTQVLLDELAVQERRVLIQLESLADTGKPPLQSSIRPSHQQRSPVPPHLSTSCQSVSPQVVEQESSPSERKTYQNLTADLERLRELLYTGPNSPQHLGDGGGMEACGAENRYLKRGRTPGSHLSSSPAVTDYKRGKEEEAVEEGLAPFSTFHPPPPLETLSTSYSMSTGLDHRWMPSVSSPGQLCSGGGEDNAVEVHSGEGAGTSPHRHRGTAVYSPSGQLELQELSLTTNEAAEKSPSRWFPASPGGTLMQLGSGNGAVLKGAPTAHSLLADRHDRKSLYPFSIARSDGSGEDSHLETLPPRRLEDEDSFIRAAPHCTSYGLPHSPSAAQRRAVSPVEERNHSGQSVVEVPHAIPATATLADRGFKWWASEEGMENVDSRWDAKAVRRSSSLLGSPSHPVAPNLVSWNALRTHYARLARAPELQTPSLRASVI